MSNVESCRLLKHMAVFHGYVVVRPIASGAEGEVWLVRHSMLQTNFAVKVIPKAILDNDAELRAQFDVEARIAGKVRHPSLVSVYDAGLDDSTGLYFLVMDFMSRGSVASRLSKEHRFSVRKAASIVQTVAKGLCELKRIGIVHRDVKPQNMLVAANGDVKLSDFGIALPLGSRRTGERDDVVIGTPLYMSYEQIADSNSIDCRADVYSLGVSFFEMLAGTCPGSKLTTDELLQARLDGERLPDVRTLNAAIPENVARLIYRMTDPAVTRRVSSPEVVVAELDAILGKEGAKYGVLGGKLMQRAILAAAVGLFSLLCYVFVKTPSWMAASRECQAQPTVCSLGEDDFAQVPDGQCDEVELRVSVVTQVVESVREVVKPVAAAPDEEPVQPEIVKTSSPVADAGAGPSEANPAHWADDKARGEVVRNVCGVRIVCESEMTNALERLSECMVLADEEVRRFFAFDKDKRVQSSVDDVRIVKSCKGAKGSGWIKKGKSLEVGLDVVEDDEELESLVTGFMTSHRDRCAVEPFEKEIYKYIRYRVWDGVSLARGKMCFGSAMESRTSSAIEFCKEVRRQYGRNDYNGQLSVYGYVRQIVPQDKVSSNRVGKVFLILSVAESLDESAIKHYFLAKRQAVSRGVLGQVVHANDFVALLSNAVGYNLFPLLVKEGWNVDKHAATVRVLRMPEPFVDM